MAPGQEQESAGTSPPWSWLSRDHGTRVSVQDQHGRPAVVALSRRRGRAVVQPVAGASPDPHLPARPEPDPEAWPTEARDRAAAWRWSDRHQSILTIRDVRPAGAPRDRAPVAAGICGVPHVPSTLSSAGRTVRPSGIRRLDLRVLADDPLVAELADAGWVVGAVGTDVVASLVVGYPWNRPVPGDPPTAAAERARRLPAWLPPRLRRGLRRLLVVRPVQLPELARVAWGEVEATVRTRTIHRGPRAHPAAGAPEGSRPFGGTRHRTIRRALALVPPSLHAAVLVDIGAGDGRVLAEAARVGFTRLMGREIDRELADVARRRLGDRATIEVGDALARQLPDDAGVVYLNNPFDRQGLERLAALVAASLRRNPRPLLVLYVNPPTIEPLEAIGLVPVHAGPQFTVLATRRQPAWG